MLKKKSCHRFHKYLSQRELRFLTNIMEREIKDIDRETTRSAVWYSLENSVPDDHDGFIHRSDQIAVKVDKAGCWRFESSHPVSGSTVR